VAIATATAFVKKMRLMSFPVFSLEFDFPFVPSAVPTSGLGRYCKGWKML